VNELLLQTFDGIPVADENEKASCSRCRTRLEEGRKVIAQFHLEKHWRIDRLYCPDCYLSTTHDDFREELDEVAVVEGRLIARSDQVTQSTVPALHTRGSYKLLRHTDNDSDNSGDLELSSFAEKASDDSDKPATTGEVQK
jgi:hypothetical protein